MSDFEGYEEYGDDGDDLCDCLDAGKSFAVGFDEELEEIGGSRWIPLIPLTDIGDDEPLRAKLDYFAWEIKSQNGSSRSRSASFGELFESRKESIRDSTWKEFHYTSAVSFKHPDHVQINNHSFFSSFAKSDLWYFDKFIAPDRPTQSVISMYRALKASKKRHHQKKGKRKQRSHRDPSAPYDPSKTTVTSLLSECSGQLNQNSSLLLNREFHPVAVADPSPLQCISLTHQRRNGRTIQKSRQSSSGQTASELATLIYQHLDDTPQ
jgi:hypothetical protein